MPNIKSAKKRLKQNIKAYFRNKAHQSATKTQVKKFFKAIKEKNIEAAKVEYREATSRLDKLCQKGVIHSNKASRTKSRLAKKLNLLCAEVAQTSEDNKE